MKRIWRKTLWKLFKYPKTSMYENEALWEAYIDDKERRQRNRGRVYGQ